MTAMDIKTDPTQQDGRTSAARTSERELTVTRAFSAPASVVFEAWTTPALLMRWWAPKSIGITFISCDVDARTGGTYRFVFGHPASEQPVAFFGHYLEVTPPSRLVWTNDEEDDAGPVTTVTFEERGAETLVTLRDLYPSKEALDAAIASGSNSGFAEAFRQLDEVLATVG
jgi:uncharacterized protein YndB with AHSA1/START domain